MAITVVCDHCERSMEIKDSFAGKTGRCPYCKQSISIPPDDIPIANALDCDPTEDARLLPPTDKQLSYALTLGVKVPEKIDRRELSKLIAAAKKFRPPTDKQKEFLRKLGIDPPEEVNFEEISRLIESALDMESKVISAVQKRLERQWREAGMLIEGASDIQLLKELDERGRTFFIFLLEDDEFRYKDNVPLTARLTWNFGLSEEDVKFIFTSMAANWASDFDLEAYAEEEYDNELPSFHINVSELGDESSES